MLVIGGYGVFGSRLVSLLIKNTSIEVIAAGRNQTKLDAFCGKFGVMPCRLDRENDVELDRVLRELSPALIIDAAGPFQSYGSDRYRIARKAIAAEIHYLDLADDRSFVTGISALDGVAKTNNVAALSGASSIPALSAAVADKLCENLRERHLIESAILPGNRAPRGVSVVRAILSQVGKPFRLWRGGQFNDFVNWSERKNITLSVPGSAPLIRRAVSLFDAPDHAIFPSRYGAKSVLFYAGLELKWMHFFVWLLGWLARLRMVTSLAPIATTAKWIADRFPRFGSDRGGMRVSVFGRSDSGVSMRHTWTLIAEAGDGQNIPAIPAAVLAEKILSGQVVCGARPCVGEFTLSEAESAMQCFSIKSHVEEQIFPTLFERALGGGFVRLPKAVQNLHTVFDHRIYKGTANIERGRGFASRFYAFIAGFPPAATDIPAEVQIYATKDGERWIRHFGSRRFQSYLYKKPNDGFNVVWEKFGAISFAIRLQADENGLHYPIEHAQMSIVPLPRFLLPISKSFEWEDESGLFHFDVSISLPTGGLIARYTGSLRPVDNFLESK